MLFKVPKGNKPEDVKVALSDTINGLSEHLWKSLTWDQGREMGQHATFTVDIRAKVYFCDPKSPWQRGSNENTKGLLRRYLPEKHRPLPTHPRHPWPGCLIPQDETSTKPWRHDTITETRPSVAMTP
jgi:IS30 family transposase